MRLNSTFVIGLFILLLASETAYTQTCDTSTLEAATPDSRFEVLGNEVYDLQTGLSWQRCSVGQSWDGSGCSGSPITYIWSDALSLATDGWRLPNIKELMSIVELACAFPAINLTVFPDTPRKGYWSSSPYASHSSFAWNVHLNMGGNYPANKSGSSMYVRLVRDAE